MIDTHAHIYLEEFKDQWEELFAECADKGLKSIYLPNIDKSTIPNLKELSKLSPDVCFPMMGLHPGSVKEDYLEELEAVRVELFDQTSNYVAVGEIGLDLYWDKSFFEAQKHAFREQITWAKELQLPIVIHVRDTFEETFEIIDELNDDKLKGIFHCFTGNIEQANHIISYGDFMLGVGGILTFKNAGLDKVIEKISLDHLVLETDSPYLTPHPHRGKQNKPSYLPIIAEKLAEVKNVSKEFVIDSTSENAFTIFGQ